MKKEKRNCSWCKIEIWRKPYNHNTKKYIKYSFCSNECKGLWQQENKKPKGVTKEWLIQKYEVEELNCREIGDLVGRDTKSVWNWLKGYGIEIRGRGSESKKQWERGERAPTFTGKNHSKESKEKIRQARIKDGRVPYLMPDGSHYMKGRRGKNHHGWKGGITPEREKLYQTDEWKEVVKYIWKRADARCELCGKDHREIDNRKKHGFHIHHILPFHTGRKQTDLNNLVLLCRPCHHWVHSKKNKNNILIEKG